MELRTTEQRHPDAGGLDARPLIEAAAVLAEGQIAAAGVTRNALSGLCDGARAMAATIRDGGVLHYAAAGSSGLMAAADAQELGGTFSIPARQLRIHMAGGLPTGVEMPGETEDEADALTEALSSLSRTDTVIAVSASGSTPYTLAAAKIARDKGATLIGIANNAGSELLQLADHAILLPTPPEVISGSTRMGAGTAQKIALNILSTLMAVEIGHIHDGMMVNLRADNHKLRDRARRIVEAAAQAGPDAARDALNRADGNVKCAILLAAGAPSAAQAQALLEQSGGRLRPAMQELTQPNS